MNPLLVIDIPGLTLDQLQSMPNLAKLAREGSLQNLELITPAVTCPVQSTFLTGEMPSRHGVVANGWFFRETSEVGFWKQSNALVSGEKVWEVGRKKNPSFTCANLFWWFNMYSNVDYSVTPRPMYTADGRKIPDCYTHPAGLRDELNEKLGVFPLFQFWGPGADIASTRWIRKAAEYVMCKSMPTLTLVYLPHLDYNLQRLGPNHPGIVNDLREIDAECGVLIDGARQQGQKILVLSEYAVSETTRPVHINRLFREKGWLAVRNEMGHEAPDFGASQAFAVCDHQVAHIYIRDKNIFADVKKALESLAGIERVLDKKTKKEFRLDHERSGELVAISQADSWFTYYHWLDDSKAPDYARTVDIHRKPGYDPVELFIDPKFRLPSVSIAWRLLKKKTGFRTLMDVISLDASLVKGSHGRVSNIPEKSPVIISSEKNTFPGGSRAKRGIRPKKKRTGEGASIHATEVKSLMLEMIFSEAPALK